MNNPICFGNVKTCLILLVALGFFACEKNRELEFKREGENTTVVQFNCGETAHPLNLVPGKYVARTTSSCKDTLVLNGQKHAFDTLDLAFEVKEGDKLALLCKEGDGMCKFTYVRVDEKLPGRQRNYLPSRQLGDDCDVDEVVILKAITDGIKVRVFYKPCVFGTVEIRVKDAQNSTVAVTGAPGSPKIEDLWFSIKNLPELNTGYILSIKCMAGENSTGNCFYAIGWRN